MIYLNGVPVFIGLLTVTNEYGEIRVCSLVATKSHAQYELALQQLSISLDLYGLDQPEVFYTDNITDRNFLVKMFPSLSTGVTPPEKHEQLPRYLLPEGTTVSVHNTATAINTAMLGIMGDLSEVGESSEPLAVGFDAEWDVYTEGPNERITGRGPTAVIQIAYKSHVYILQVCDNDLFYFLRVLIQSNHTQVYDMIRSGTLPHHLKMLLQNPQILKVGHMVHSDLRMLETACRPERPFQGGVELLRYAQGLYVPLPSKNPSLSDLCATVLGRCLPKNVAERVGETWSSATLTPAQIDYAARDASVSLAIYNRLASIPIPQIIPNDPSPLPPAGTPVLLFSGNKLVARGRLVSRPVDGVFDAVPLHNHALVEIAEVLVPGALIKSHRDQPLSSFGPTPFSVVAERQTLRTYQPIGVLAPPDLGTATTTANMHHPESPSSDELDDMDAPPVLNNESARISDIILDLFDLENRPNAYSRLAERHGGDLQIDDEALREGLNVLGEMPREWRSEIRSRVLKDPFHVFNMFYISTAHGLRVDFARALRDAIFLLDPEDVAHINEWGQRQNPLVNVEWLLLHRPRWLLARCKRIIPPPEQLYPAVAEVFKTWGALKDAKTGAPLFNKAAWKTAKHILELIYGGFLSDPPGIPLYSVMGLGGKSGLPVYRCFRGTNATEGGVHSHLRSHLPSSGTSIRHALACLKDFVLRHNLLVCIVHLCVQLAHL